MLKSFKIMSSNLDAQVSLYEGEAAKFGTWTSVIIGQNGSRKSFILRQIVDAAIGEPTKSGSKAVSFEAIGVNWEKGKLPESITCISGTPLDRFPRLRNFSLGVPLWKAKSGERKEFLYLGPRASNGMAGTAPSERALMTSLFLNAEKLTARSHLFEAIFHEVGFEPKILISLRLARELTVHGQRYNAMQPSLIPGPPERGLENVFTSKLQPFLDAGYAQKLGPRLEAALNRIISMEGWGFYELLKMFKRNEKPPAFIFKDGHLQLETPINSSFSLGGDELEIYIRAGVILINNTTFYKVQGDYHPAQRDKPGCVALNGEDLSSGQWSWIAGFAGLCAEIIPKSLVLIDEPENSLHPIWQQTYVPTLNKILREFKGSQAVIVTHSPLIASGVDPEWGRVEALVNHGIGEDGRQIIKSETVNSTFGWRASDVYEEVFQVPSSRAPAFTITADIALGLLRSGDQVCKEEFRFLKEELTRDLEALPITDPLRNILTSIIKDLESRFASLESLNV